MPKFIVTTLENSRLATAICDQAGIEARLVRRLVIDLKVGNAGMIYLELFATDDMIDVNLNETGISIAETQATV